MLGEFRGSRSLKFALVSGVFWPGINPSTIDEGGPYSVSSDEATTQS